MNLDKLRNIKNEIIMMYCRCIPREKAMVLLYQRRYNKKLDLKNPKYFSEYLQILMIKRYGIMESKCADKFLVRHYIESKGLNYILTNLYGNWKKWDDSILELLPNSFVLKATHGCGYNIIVRNKEVVNKKEIGKKMNRWLKTDYSKKHLEYHYNHSYASIIAEEYIDTLDESEIIDYKFHCINGKVAGILVCSERSTGLKLTWYDTEWNKCIENIEDRFQSDVFIEKPQKLDEMIDIANIIAKDFEFVRVDLYNVGDKIYFGELSFTPEAGRPGYFTEKLQLELGYLFRDVLQ